MTGEPLTFLSMGWGVQTWTLAAMMALHEAPRPDYIVFADTHHEHQDTYAFIRRWAPWLGEHGLSVYRVEANPRRTEIVRQEWSNSVMIPAFTVDMATGKEGQVRRQCTQEWKIKPIRRFVRDRLEDHRRKVEAGAAEMWQGISWDEAIRMRDSDVQFISNRYPLVDRRMTRMACKQWLESRALPEPPKSACTFCPFKSIAAWKDLKRKGGADWREAVEVDTAIRDKRVNRHGYLYVHPACRPLPEAIAIPEDEGAYQYEFDITCDSGYCMV